MLYDELLLRLGDFGRYHKTRIFLLCIVSFTSSLHSMNMVFIGGTPEHHCKEVQMNRTVNISQPQRFNWSVPRDNDEKKGTCKILNRTTLEGHHGDISNWVNNATYQDCETGWTFAKDVYKSTIVSEWGLVCEYKWKRSVASTIFFAGRLVGALVAGQISDRFGRRPTFFAAVAGQVLFGCAASFVPHWYLFCILYFFQGVAQVAVYLCAYIIGNELVTPANRKLVVALEKMSYASGQLGLCLISFCIRDWRYIELTISLLPAVYFFYYWALPESTRWLLTQGRVQEAKEEIKKMAKMNKVALSEKDLDSLEVEERNRRTYTFIDLLKGWRIAKLSLTVWFNWMVCSMMYYGLNINTRNLAGDPYVNFLISALVELPSCLYFFLFLDKVGRRKSFLFFSFMAGTVCGIMAFIGDKTAVRVLSMIGKLAATAAYAIIYLLATEVFPTVARNVGVGFASVCARIGGMLVPQILLLGEYVAPLPMIMFGACSITGAVLGFLSLPEPTGKPLPQTFDDMGKKKRKTMNGYEGVPMIVSTLKDTAGSNETSTTTKQAESLNTVVKGTNKDGRQLPQDI